MSFRFDIGNSQLTLQERFRYSKEAVTNAAIEKMTSLLQQLRLKAQAYTKGPYSSKGDLAASIQEPDVFIQGYKIIGNIGYGEGLPYAVPLEKGGQSRYPIAAVNKKALMMMIDGKAVFAKYLSNLHPPAPRKAYMQHALDDMIGEIEAGLQEAVEGALRKK